MVGLVVVRTGQGLSHMLMIIGLVLCRWMLRGGRWIGSSLGFRLQPAKGVRMMVIQVLQGQVTWIMAPPMAA